MKPKKFVLSHNGISWFLYHDGQLVGYPDDDHDIPTYQFWVGNPPAPDSKDHSLFVAVCEFAVAHGMLRPIHVYALTPESKT